MRTGPALTRLVRGPLVSLLAAGCGGDLTLPGSGDPSGLQAVSGDRQEAEAGALLPAPLIVRAIDAAGRPVQGALIVFRFNGDVGGEIVPANARTDSVGTASAEVRLGTATGDQIVEASVPEAAPDLTVTFRLTAIQQDDDGEVDDRGGEGNHGKGGKEKDDDD